MSRKMIQATLWHCLLLLLCIGCKKEDVVPQPVEENSKETLAECVVGTFIGTASGIEVGEVVTNYKINVDVVNDSTIELNSAHFEKTIVSLSKNNAEDDFLTGRNNSLESFLYEIPFELLTLRKDGLLKFSFQGIMQ